MKPAPLQSLTLLMLVALAALAVMSPGLAAAVSPGIADGLRGRALSQGEVRVIVEIAAPQAVLGDMSSALRQSRLQQIAGLQATLMSQARQPGMREIARFRTIPFMALYADAAAIDRLANLPQVLSIVEDIPETVALASSVPIIGAPIAWAGGYEGAGEVIAILDTGVQTTHAFFPPGKVLAEACFSTNQGLMDGRYSTSLCPGAASASTAPGSGQNCPNSVSSSCTHGTHVAGIAAGNDGIGPNIGVAKGAGLITIQVFTCLSSQVNCGGFSSLGSYTTDQVLALEHVLALSENMNIAAVNMSLGGAVFSSQASCDSVNAARKAAIDNLRSVGIATIISSGNNSSKTSIAQPGCISSAISVGNTTDADDIANSSNVSSFLDLLAPGSLIDSAAVGGGVVSNSGTSMAAPHVAGAWAILREAAPAATLDEILQILRDTGESVDDQRTGGTVDDMRRINLDLALAALVMPEPNIVTDPVAASALDFGEVLLNTVSDLREVQVSNNGNQELSLACSLAGTDAGAFAIMACPESVSAHTQVFVSVRCEPNSQGMFVAELQISSNDPDTSLLSFELSCQGVPPENIFTDGFELAQP